MTVITVEVYYKYCSDENDIRKSIIEIHLDGEDEWKSDNLYNDLQDTRVHEVLSILDDYGLPTHISEDDVVKIEVDYEQA